ncbi:peptidase inhibitor family I36 protein [Pseudomonas sp. PCH199]|uniref:peptidase inhibitor family I36 protein n=1 Tax=unclassified Pseudomonas TaxID=196821 RepID=UPI000BDDAD75|nr:MULTISPECIES: peptidase inhibitor family I36 protein [unclassified Pseudomonas]MCW8275478.1 peptidase inhibitor family I36 protein [Pseudomonas sp. PCH199]PAM84352.1 hypothetical protein CES87_07210 [Pseudomonas sp. ERMR1:02]
MNAQWSAGLVAVCVGIGALFFSARHVSIPPSPYTLFEPVMTAEQKAEVQRQIDRQLNRKSGGQQVSATQVAYAIDAIVLTFPVPGASGQSDSSCDYGYFCVWDAWDYTGRKLSLRSTPSSRPVNLSDFGMNGHVSSWQHHNKVHTVKIFGVDGPGAKGNIMMSNLKEVGLGKGCCPFSIPDQVSVTGAWTEIYSQSRLAEYNDRMISVAFSPMFILFAQ